MSRRRLILALGAGALMAACLTNVPAPSPESEGAAGHPPPPASVPEVSCPTRNEPHDVPADGSWALLHQADRDLVYYTRSDGALRPPRFADVRAEGPDTLEVLLLNLTSPPDAEQPECTAWRAGFNDGVPFSRVGWRDICRSVPDSMFLPDESLWLDGYARDRYVRDPQALWVREGQPSSYVAACSGSALMGEPALTRTGDVQVLVPYGCAAPVDCRTSGPLLVRLQSDGGVLRECLSKPPSSGRDWWIQGDEGATALIAKGLGIASFWRFDGGETQLIERRSFPEGEPYSFKFLFHYRTDAGEERIFSNEWSEDFFAVAWPDDSGDAGMRYRELDGTRGMTEPVLYPARYAKHRGDYFWDYHDHTNKKQLIAQFDSASERILLHEVPHKAEGIPYASHQVRLTSDGTHLYQVEMVETDGGVEFWARQVVEADE